MLTTVVVYLLVMHVLGFFTSLFIQSGNDTTDNVTRVLALLNILAVVFVLVSI